MTQEEMEALVAPFVRDREALTEDWWSDFFLGVAIGGILEGEYMVTET